jgi:hypothetical protein
MKIASFDERQQRRRLAILDEHRQRKIWPFVLSRPLRGSTLPAGIIFCQVTGADDAKNEIRICKALVHPLRDIAAPGNLPFMNTRHMAELFQLLANPECPILVFARIADENVRHRLAPAAWAAQ